tara:strand:+ start:51 stop:551 length:501 start_codon:yes stop_codon:yes gene_type:complete
MKQTENLVSPNNSTTNTTEKIDWLSHNEIQDYAKMEIFPYLEGRDLEIAKMLVDDIEGSNGIAEMNANLKRDLKDLFCKKRSLDFIKLNIAKDLCNDTKTDTSYIRGVIEHTMNSMIPSQDGDTSLSIPWTLEDHEKFNPNFDQNIKILSQRIMGEVKKIMSGDFV